MWDQHLREVEERIDIGLKGLVPLLDRKIGNIGLHLLEGGVVNLRQNVSYRRLYQRRYKY